MKLNNHVGVIMIGNTYMQNYYNNYYRRWLNENAPNISDENREERIKADKWFLSDDNNKLFYVSNSVVDKLLLLDSKKCLTKEGWRVFDKLPNLYKKTFLLPDGKCIRVGKRDFMSESRLAISSFQRTNGFINKINYPIKINNNSILEESICNSEGTLEVEFVYSLLCFVELCENEIIVLNPGSKIGTQKSGRVLNDTSLRIPVINNNWNITTIRVDGFPVRGHVAIRWCGVGRIEPKLIYIAPFEKRGYLRRAGKEIQA